MKRPIDHNEPSENGHRQPTPPRPRRKSRARAGDASPTRSPAEKRTDFALELLGRFASCAGTAALADLAQVLSGQRPYRPYFPEDGTRLAVEVALNLVPELRPEEPDLRERLEQAGVFLVVRSCKAHIYGADDEDAALADRCLGPLMAFTAAVLHDAPGLAPNEAHRRRLLVSLDARLPEAWSRAKRAHGENVLQMAYRASQRKRVRLLHAGARELDEDVASIAHALSRLEKDRVVALPQVAIGELLDVPHQRISESIERLVRAGFLTRLAKGDPVNGMAATYKIRVRSTAGIFRVFDRQ